MQIWQKKAVIEWLFSRGGCLVPRCTVIDLQPITGIGAMLSNNGPLLQPGWAIGPLFQDPRLNPAHYKYIFKCHCGGKLRGHVNIRNGRYWYVLSTMCKTPEENVTFQA